jgi:hypothetical protein
LRPRVWPTSPSLVSGNMTTPKPRRLAAALCLCNGLSHWLRPERSHACGMALRPPSTHTIRTDRRRATCDWLATVLSGADLDVAKYHAGMVGLPACVTLRVRACVRACVCVCEYVSVCVGAFSLSLASCACRARPVRTPAPRAPRPRTRLLAPPPPLSPSSPRRTPTSGARCCATGATARSTSWWRRSRLAWASTAPTCGGWCTGTSRRQWRGTTR